MTIELTRPTACLYDSWAAAVTEFGGVHIGGSGTTAPVQGDRETLDALIARADLLADTTASPRFALPRRPASPGSRC